MRSRLLFAALVIGVASLPATATTGQYGVSIVKVRLLPGERIVGLDLRMKPAIIAELGKVPRAWHLSIDNDPSMVAELKGSLLVGAGALETQSLTNLLTIDCESPPPDTSGEVIVTKDFEHERTIKLTAENFAFQHR
jgi:hypothetical protein